MKSVNKKLIVSAEEGLEFEVEALLQKPGCNALIPGVFGMTVLMRAASKGHEACVRLLLPVSDAGAMDEEKITALMWAARGGHKACVELLIPASDTSAQDASGLTALMGAAGRGYAACVQLLLPASDALVQDSDGRTASARARRGGHEVVAELIDAYVLAQHERTTIGDALGNGTPHKRASPRM